MSAFTKGRIVTIVLALLCLVAAQIACGSQAAAPVEQPAVQAKIRARVRVMIPSASKTKVWLSQSLAQKPCLVRPKGPPFTSALIMHSRSTMA